MNPSTTKLQVFISYARDDAAPFAAELLAGLEAAGFDPFLDRHDIAGGEPWVERLAALLQRADTMVFVITRAALTSRYCSWELDRAEQLSKRIIPVLATAVPQEDVPSRLRRLNYVSFVEQSFGMGLRELAEALRVDLEWVREHTRIGELAARWDARERSKALLLRGEELVAAKGWLGEWKGGEPLPTELQRAFLNESEAAEQAQFSEERRRLQEVATAQDARAKALARAGRANVITLVVVLVLLGVTVAGLVQFYLLQTELQDVRVELANARSGLELIEDRQQEAVAIAEDFERKVDDVYQRLPDDTRGRLPWSIDIFWCEGSPNRPRAEALAEALEEERARQVAAGGPGEPGLSFPLDRVRVRVLKASTNARRGYQIGQDEIRPEASEAAQGASLARFVAANGGTPLIEKTSTTPTPYYLSVFLCSGKRGSR